MPSELERAYQTPALASTNDGVMKSVLLRESVQTALGGKHALNARVDACGDVERFGEALEDRFQTMMDLFAGKQADVKIHARFHAQRLKEFVKDSSNEPNKLGFFAITGADDTHGTSDN